MGVIFTQSARLFTFVSVSSETEIFSSFCSVGFVAWKIISGIACEAASCSGENCIVSVNSSPAASSGSTEVNSVPITVFSVSLELESVISKEPFSVASFQSVFACRFCSAIAAPPTVQLFVSVASSDCFFVPVVITHFTGSIERQSAESTLLPNAILICIGMFFANVFFVS